MDIIRKKRGKGKTTELIKMSSRTGIPIAYCGQNDGYIMRLATILGHPIPEPVHISMVNDMGYASVYIDDADCALIQLLGVDIPAISITDAG